MNFKRSFGEFYFKNTLQSVIIISRPETGVYVKPAYTKPAYMKTTDMIMMYLKTGYLKTTPACREGGTKFDT